MKYLIVGLGNPGKEYEGTRHNIGFSALDAIAQKRNASFEVSRLGMWLPLDLRAGPWSF
jgi:PTH1 family peptidyl-tRNA hydrolase